MKPLICDICGGRLTISSGGVAICDSCGMEHTKERMKEKVQEIQGTVQIDNSHMIENYLTMAHNAYDSHNALEAESYCNKVLEIEPNNCQAWLLKGKSIGFYSSLQDTRFSEVISCFLRVISNFPEESREEIIYEISEEIKKISISRIVLRGKNFERHHSEIDASGFISDINAISDGLKQYSTQIKQEELYYDIFQPIARRINKVIVLMWVMRIERDYTESYKTIQDWKIFLERVDCCKSMWERIISILNESYKFCNFDPTSKDYYLILHHEFIIFFYENLITLENKIDFYFPDNLFHELSSSNTRICRNRILEYETKISKLDKELDRIIEEKRKEELLDYWKENADEKIKLENENTAIIQQLSKLKTDQVSEKVEKDRLIKQINQLEDEKIKLNFLRSKKKKTLQNQIDDKKEELLHITIQVKEVQSKIELLERRQAEIKAQLTTPCNIHFSEKRKFRLDEKLP